MNEGGVLNVAGNVNGIGTALDVVGEAQITVGGDVIVKAYPSDAAEFPLGTTGVRLQEAYRPDAENRSSENQKVIINGDLKVVNQMTDATTTGIVVDGQGGTEGEVLVKGDLIVDSLGYAQGISIISYEESGTTAKTPTIAVLGTIQINDKGNAIFVERKSSLDNILIGKVEKDDNASKLLTAVDGMTQVMVEGSSSCGTTYVTADETFKLIKYYLKASDAVENGTITAVNNASRADNNFVIAGETYKYGCEGDVITVTATANEGFYVESVQSGTIIFTKNADGSFSAFVPRGGGMNDIKAIMKAIEAVQETVGENQEVIVQVNGSSDEDGVVTVSVPVVTPAQVASQVVSQETGTVAKALASVANVAVGGKIDLGTAGVATVTEQGLSVNLGREITFTKATMEALSTVNKDIEVAFKYAGKDYQFDIPKGINVSLFANKEGYAGMLYLSELFGRYEMVNGVKTLVMPGKIKLDKDGKMTISKDIDISKDVILQKLVADGLLIVK